MKTTRRDERHADYLGVDPSDRYARRCRPIDVCGLTLQADGRFAAVFWQWHWSAPGTPLDVHAILAEIQAARATLVDGPQALASPGMPLRSAERLCRAAGKTPDRMPISGPYSGFIRSSLELFAACADAGVAIGRVDWVGGMGETYPGAVWRRLAPRLPKKNSLAGRRSRKALLEQLGVTSLPDRPSHDQLDACLCALLAAAVDGKITAISVRALGQPLMRDTDGVWREGTIIVIEHAPILHDIASEPTAREAPAMTKNPFTDEQRKRALALRDELVAQANAGAAQLCTYAWAYQHIFANSPTKWSQAYARQVIAIARAMAPVPLQALGSICLDAFIVAASSGLPSAGHWLAAPYTQGQWSKLFAGARVRAPGNP